MCSGLIPSVTEKSVIFVKELSFPKTAPTDDAFFQPDWLERVRVVGPDLDCCWAGLQAPGSSGLKLDCCSVGLQAMGVALLCKNNKEGGSARASPVAAPMPESVSFLEKRETV